MGEIVSVMMIPKNKAKLIDNEINWLQNFNLFVDTDLAKKHLEIWEIRCDKSKFENWLKERKIFKLFFTELQRGIQGWREGEGLSFSRKGK